MELKLKLEVMPPGSQEWGTVSTINYDPASPDSVVAALSYLAVQKDRWIYLRYFPDGTLWRVRGLDWLRNGPRHAQDAQRAMFTNPAGQGAIPHASQS